MWGDAGWYYITPDGTLYLWAGGTVEDSVVGQLDGRFYDNLSALTTASEASSIDDIFQAIAVGDTVL